MVRTAESLSQSSLSQSSLFQSWNPKRYAEEAGFVSELGFPLIELLNPRPDERILDLGCGEGALTEKLVASGAGVLGVDQSPEQVAAAVARGLDARVIDAKELSFDAEFDAVLSNAALHWMHPPEIVCHRVFRALKPGGRFVCEMGASGNIAAIVTALNSALGKRDIDSSAVNPWYFPDENEYRTLLEGAGFKIINIETFKRPTSLPGDIKDWLEIFAGSFILAVAKADRGIFVDEVRNILMPELMDAGGNWMVDNVRLRFFAKKP